MICSLFALLGAFIYRMRGGMAPSFPRPVDQVLFSLPYGIVVGVCWWKWFSVEWGMVVGVLSLIATTIAVSKGHGNSMDLGDGDAGPEWYEFAMKWLKPKEPPPSKKWYWYDAFGLMLSGLSYTVVSGILSLNIFLLLSGVLKALAYMLAKRAGAGTEGGELLTGALLWGAIWCTTF